MRTKLISRQLQINIVQYEAFAFGEVSVTDLDAHSQRRYLLEDFFLDGTAEFFVYGLLENKPACDGKNGKKQQ